MSFSRKESNGTLTCTLCRHYCHLKAGQRGRCGINQNNHGTIECLAYGYPAALQIDPIEKKPLYHFLPGSKIFSLGSAGCNFRCPFCQNWQLSQRHSVDRDHYYTPAEIAERASESDCAAIAFTYNEPTIFYPYARDIAIAAKARGVRTVMVSNGFESPETIDDMRGIIDAVNVDLKSFDADYYRRALGGDLEGVLDTLRRVAQSDIWLEITTLIVPTKNDSDTEISAMASFIATQLGADTPWHISAFHPDYKQRNLPTTDRATLERAAAIGRASGLNYIYLGNVGRESTTRCPACDTLLIERTYTAPTISHIKEGRCPNCNHTIAGVFDA